MINVKSRRYIPNFERQVETLINKGYPEAAGLSEVCFFTWYIKPLKKFFKKGDLIVIPQRFVSIPRQMKMVELNGEAGYTNLHLGELRQADGVSTPEIPYLIRDVDYGAATLNLSREDCFNHFKENNRFGLVVEEGISIVIYEPWVLTPKLCINLLGSSCHPYDFLSYIPILHLDGCRPGLFHSGTCYADLKGFSASCESRITRDRH
jgi:hypothetical protein